MNNKALIVGIKGLKLTKNEEIFLKKNRPWGVILFTRNIKNLAQLKLLIDSIKKTINNKNYPILIDVEGGRVSRLNKIIDLSLFSQNFFEKLYLTNKKLFLIYYKIYIDTISNIFKDVGININTVPVLDVRRINAHKIIGNRSFSTNAKNVTILGNICINLFNKNKIATVIKHIPGHGLSKNDSHHETPVINAKKSELKKIDFLPFKNCNSIFAMTAHNIYKSYDKENTATHSKIIIKTVIRNYIKFKGILISDDISMKSLKFNLEENAIKALEAGCNLILHCNGNISQMNKLAKIIPKIDKITQKKTSHFYNFIG